MLVLKNGNGVMAEGGIPLVNNEVNALRIENSDRVTIGLVTTGPISISWGDGTVLNLSTQTDRYNASKLYGSVGIWNISITNTENVKAIYFDNTYLNAKVDKINTSVSWFTQFRNIEYIFLYNATFNGDLGAVIESSKLSRIWLRYDRQYNFTFNISNCKSFWKRCVSVHLNIMGGNDKGSFSDIDLNLNISYINLTLPKCTGNVSGVIKNGYTSLTTIVVQGASLEIGAIGSLDNFIIPDTLISITFGGFINLGYLKSFDFKYLTIFNIYSPCTEINFANNTSFDFFAANSTSFFLYGIYSTPGQIDLSKFTRRDPNKLYVIYVNGTNVSYTGDVSSLFSYVSNLYITSKNQSDLDGSIITFDNIPNGFLLGLNNLSVSISSEVIKNKLSKASGINITRCPKVTGDISGFVVNTSINSGYGIVFSSLANLYCDITTINFGLFLTTTYAQIVLSYNPHFTGDLGNLNLWQNKQEINLRNCEYTGIPGFVRKVFTNRNTCLKAAGGMTNISVQGNVDNASLTGTYQQPSLGTYTGNINDLTEAQIDNLANGLDYTGTGTNTAWTDKEKIWVITKLKNSSTDSSLRYRCTFSY